MLIVILLAEYLNWKTNFFRINITIINKTSTNLMALFFLWKTLFQLYFKFLLHIFLLNIVWIILHFFFKLTLSYVVYKNIEKSLLSD